MTNLINRQATESQLMSAPITWEGKRYQPTTHKEIIETIDEYLDKHNFRVREKHYLASQGGQKAIGKVYIDYTDSEIGYSLFWKNSLDGCLTFGLAAGSHTFICSNGCVYGDISSYKRKHMGNGRNEILGQLQFACERMEDTMKLHIERKNRLKEIEVSKRLTAEIVGRLFIEESIITSTQLNIIANEIQNPSYDYKADGTAWQLYSHCTHAIKETTPAAFLSTHQKVGDFFVNNF